MQNYRELPKLRDSLSYLYIEYAIIEKKQNAIEFIKADGRTLLPISSLSALFLGPGTSVTHAAVAALAQNGCSIIWTGQDSTKFYAQGTGETRKGQNLLQQAYLVAHHEKRQQVVIAMYKYRFNEALDNRLTLPQIRGKEGVRVRMAYKEASEKYGVHWNGRQYERGAWAETDPINRALSAANALLNGICHAAIVSGGYSPGLGFIHTGKQLSFVYDVADLYKADITIPTAFRVVGQSEENIEPRIRTAIREKFHETKLLQRILPDIDTLLTVDDPIHIPDVDDMIDVDSGLPTKLWHKIEGEDA